MKDVGIYIHVPFCVRRCPYCGFYSNACWRDGYEKRIGEYFELLKKELFVRAGSSHDARGMDDACRMDDASVSRFSVDSIYFGGGTPSLASPDLIGEMIDDIKSLYSVSDDCEISMEANPGTLTEQSLKGYRAAGINRLSIGLQSFDPDVLKTLGRIHSAEDFVQSFEAARDAGFDNISTDLMFGIPGQSRKIWASTLDRVMSLRPEHVSFYSLQIEEGTPFYDQYKMGDMVPVSDEDDRAMYHEAIKCLGENGYNWYEISNAAIPGKECRHNLKYWTFKDYLGIGASASSFLDGVRRTNPSDRYAEFVAGMDAPAEEDATGAAERAANMDLLAENHENSLFDNASDYMITGLRLTCGISTEDFETRFGKSVWEFFQGAKEELTWFFDEGYIKEDNGRIYITEKGMDISNKIMACFV